MLITTRKFLENMQPVLRTLPDFKNSVSVHNGLQYFSVRLEVINSYVCGSGHELLKQATIIHRMEKVSLSSKIEFWFQEESCFSLILNLKKCYSVKKKFPTLNKILYTQILHSDSSVYFSKQKIHFFSSLYY